MGTVGYLLIEGWALSDAIYMTAITITAVGYHEVHPLSQMGRFFTGFLILSGITWMGGWFALLTASLVELSQQPFFRRRRTMKAVEKLRDHIIVCGAGRTGTHVVAEFASRANLMS